MNSQERRSPDPEILHLDGGLFADTLLHAPVEPEVVPEQLPSETGAVEKAVASVRGRHRRGSARIAGWTTAAAAAGLVALGVAAASQMPSSSGPTRPQEAAVLVTGQSSGAPVGPAGAIPDTSATVASASPGPATEMPHAAEMPQGNHVTGAGAPPAVVAASPGKMAPATSMAPATAASSGPTLLEAVAAPREFSRPGAAIAIASAARGARACLAPGDARTTMPVRVVFAPSGRVTSASLQGGPFLGTPTGSCIASALHSARVGAFDGAATAVTTTINIR